jgi:hypothetical protein
MFTCVNVRYLLLKQECYCTTTLGMHRGRLSLGIPYQWDKVESLLLDTGRPAYPERKPNPPFEKKWPDIPTLDNYGTELPDCFWVNFPFSPVPKGLKGRELRSFAYMNPLKPFLTNRNLRKVSQFRMFLFGLQWF